MGGYAGFEEGRVKHLEMIQTVISRLGTDSFLVKGWAVTVSGAFLGFGIEGKSTGLALAAALPAILFWGLDAYFLKSERLFRALHEAVRTGSPPIEPFFMAATHSAALDSSASDGSWWASLNSATLVIFYGTLVMSALVTAAIICG